MSGQGGCGRGCVELIILAFCGVLAVVVPVSIPVLIVILALILAIEIVGWLKKPVSLHTDDDEEAP